MDNKIMRVYYGIDGLPYKDKERTVHYPIAGKVGGGSVITGENNTTTIEFYVGLVGSNSKTYVATIKKPSGTLLYRVLSAGVSTDDDYYVSLDVAEIYANEVGNLVVGLNGYDGNTNITTDDDDLVINGNTTCIALGTINILCNYAPQVLTNAYGLDPSDLQLLLTEINKKADKLYTIVVVNQLNSTLEFDNNQIVFSIADKKFYKYVDSETYPNNFVVATDYYSKSEIDALLNGKQDTLVSGTNIKTINGESILGSGNINIQGGGGETYTPGNGITIDSQNKISANITHSENNGYINVGSIPVKVYDDTNLREVAEGKCKAFVIDDTLDLATIKSNITNNGYKCYENGVNITTQVLGWISDETINKEFQNSADAISVNNDGFIVVLFQPYNSPYYEFYNVNDIRTGDIVLVKQLNVPDRWFDRNTYFFQKLETTKVDLTNYATIGYVDTELAKKLSITFSGASAYDNTATYDVGDRVIYNSKLYRCTTAVSVAEDFDIAKWTEITLNDYPTKSGDETITGNWTFDKGIIIRNSYRDSTFSMEDGGNGALYFKIGNTQVANLKEFGFGVKDLSAFSDDLYNIGSNVNRFKDIFFSHALMDGKSNYGLTSPDTTGWGADKELATTDQTFNVLDASTMFSFGTTLKDTAFAIITNGKPTKIVGTFKSRNDVLLYKSNISWQYYSFACITNQGLEFIVLNTNTKSFNEDFKTAVKCVSNESYETNLVVKNIKGKALPAYPTTNTSPQYLQIGANGGNLSWTDMPSGITVSSGSLATTAFGTYTGTGDVRTQTFTAATTNAPYVYQAAGKQYDVTLKYMPTGGLAANTAIRITKADLLTALGITGTVSSYFITGNGMRYSAYAGPSSVSVFEDTDYLYAIEDGEVSTEGMVINIKILLA